MGWRFVQVMNDTGGTEGEIRWPDRGGRPPAGWEAECVECDQVISTGHLSASAALAALEEHTTDRHADRP